jgi:hypothetical protein
MFDVQMVRSDDKGSRYVSVESAVMCGYSWTTGTDRDSSSMAARISIEGPLREIRGAAGEASEQRYPFG